MIPNNFGLQRHPEIDLIALPFPNIGDLSNKSLEIINPEWIEDTTISSIQGVTTSVQGYHCAIVDVSEYDYVIIPCGKDGPNGVYSGLCTGPGTTLSYRITPTAPSANTEYILAYFCLKVLPSANYAAVTVKSDSTAPIIGIKIQ